MFDPLSRYDGLTYWAPLSTSRAETLLGLLHLDETSVVADVGCGRAELLVQLVERHNVEAVAIDSSPEALRMMRSELDRRAPAARVRTQVADANEVAPPERLFDHVTCIGGPLIGADLASTIGALSTWVRPGGTLLLGLGTWASPPPAAYLEATGIEEGSIHTHLENIEIAQRAGLTLLYSCLSNRDEWDHFEGRILLNLERAHAASPDEPALLSRLQRTRAFHDAQLRWGREAMGFGYYLLLLPPTPRRPERRAAG